jgi:hypothetical protein
MQPTDLLYPEQADFIDWDEVDNFTPEIYDTYVNAPMYEIDGLRSPEAGHAYWWETSKQCAQSSRNKIGKWQKEGKSAIETNEQSMLDPSFGVFDLSSAIAGQGIPFASAQIDERVALLSINPPQPTVVALQEKQIPYVNAINTLMRMELEANNYETLVYGCHYDNEFFNAAIIKTTVNRFERGPYGQMGRIVIEQVDPGSVFWDPLAKKLHWNHMDFIVQIHEMEIGEIRRQYPFTSKGINPEFNDIFAASNKSQDYIQSPVPKLARSTATSRKKLHVCELWIKDSRLKFQPKISDLKPKSGKYEDRFMLDEDGYIIGDWVPRYPDGRLLISCCGRVLKDVANPLAHGQAPFIFIQSAPRREPATLGNAPKIMTITRKMNDVIRRVHRYLQTEIIRPHLMSTGALALPEQADRIPDQADDVIELVQGGRWERPQPSDIPASTMPYLSSLQNALDLVSGSSAVMRGQISDGAQMSAEALSALQQYASSRLALTASHFNVGIKQLGYQLMWLIRQHYDEEIDIPVTMPDGSTTPYSWKSDRTIFEKGDPTAIYNLRTKEDYTVGIKFGTGQPGNGKQQQGPLLELKREGCLDRKGVLDGIEYPDRQFIDQRMRATELQDATAKGVAKELGINLNEQIKADRPDPGRKEKE